MSVVGLIFDSLLAMALVWLAVRVLVTPGDFKAVVLFIAFGLLMALTWLRLSAPDVALAEAAIGAGLTGVLFLDAVRAMAPRCDTRPAGEDDNGG